MTVNCYLKYNTNEIFIETTEYVGKGWYSTKFHDKEIKSRKIPKTLANKNYFTYISLWREYQKNPDNTELLDDYNFIRPVKDHPAGKVYSYASRNPDYVQYSDVTNIKKYIVHAPDRDEIIYMGDWHSLVLNWHPRTVIHEDPIINKMHCNGEIEYSVQYSIHSPFKSPQETMYRSDFYADIKEARKDFDRMLKIVKNACKGINNIPEEVGK